MAFCSPPALPTQRANVRRNVPRCSAANDLIVVGAGALGLRAARLWKAAHPDASILCATWSDSRHNVIKEEGFEATLAKELTTPASNVVFCAPPSKAGDKYPQSVADAAELATASFVFTSSTGVYEDAEHVTEDSALSDSPRAMRLREAEKYALEKGKVLRLGGLYDSVRGPHAMWLRNGECSTSPNGLLNMLHYDDAANAVIKAIEYKGDQKIFLIVDGAPLTRLELVETAMKHFRFDHFAIPRFGTASVSVKKCDSSLSRKELGWAPQWTSFAQHMEADNDAIMRNEPMVVPSFGQWR